MPFPKTCFSPLQIFPKTVAIGSPSRSWSRRRSRSRGPKPAAKIDHVTNVVVGSCCWLRVFLLHRIASHRLVSFRFVFTRLVWLPLADAALLHAACCQVRLKRTFDWFVGGSDRERRKERERGGQLHLAFWWKKDVFLVSVIFFWWRLSLSLLSYFRNRHYLPAKVKMPQSAANYER